MSGGPGVHPKYREGYIPVEEEELQHSMYCECYQCRVVRGEEVVSESQ